MHQQNLYHVSPSKSKRDGMVHSSSKFQSMYTASEGSFVLRLGRIKELICKSLMSNFYGTHAHSRANAYSLKL